jgi:hypothetical protein
MRQRLAVGVGTTTRTSCAAQGVVDQAVGACCKPYERLQVAGMARSHDVRGFGGRRVVGSILLGDIERKAGRAQRAG